MSRFRNLALTGFLLGVLLLPSRSLAQQLSLTMDLKALQTLLKKHMDSSYALSGPFSVEDLSVQSIKNGKLYGNFDLLFDSTISIPIPIVGKRTISISKTFTLSYSVIPVIQKGVLKIPVRNINVGGGGLSISLGSRTIGIMVRFKRWLFSSQGQSLLDKAVRLDFRSLLNKYLKKQNWDVVLKLGTNSLTVTAQPSKKSS